MKSLSTLFWLVATIIVLGGGPALNQQRVATTVSAPSGALTLASGATAQTLFNANEVINGCAIINPLTATEQGIGAAESITISFITTAVAGGGRPTSILEAGQAIACPQGLTQPVSWIATTTSHAINVVKW
jgi:hypothetical protein